MSEVQTQMQEFMEAGGIKRHSPLTKGGAHSRRPEQTKTKRQLKEYQSQRKAYWQKAQVSGGQRDKRKDDKGSDEEPGGNEKNQQTGRERQGKDEMQMKNNMDRWDQGSKH